MADLKFKPNYYLVAVFVMYIHHTQAQCLSYSLPLNERACTLHTIRDLSEARYNLDTLNDILAYSTTEISVLVNHDGNFDELKKLEASNNSSIKKAVAVDLNHDGVDEIIYSASNVLGIFHGSVNIDSTYADEDTIQLQLNDFVAVDFDNDTLIDIVGLSSTNDIELYKNLGNLTFSPAILLYKDSSGLSTRRLGIFDLENDNDNDICYTRGPHLNIIENNNQNFSRLTVVTPTTADGGQTRIASRDIDNDGYMDIIYAQTGPGLMVHWNLGLDSNLNHQGFTTYKESGLSSVHDFTIHDWDDDNDLDILLSINTSLFATIARLVKKPTRTFGVNANITNDVFVPGSVLLHDISHGNQKELVTGSTNGHILAYPDFNNIADDYYSISTRTKDPSFFIIENDESGFLNRLITDTYEDLYRNSFQFCRKSTYNNEWRANYIRTDYINSFSRVKIDLDHDGTDDIFAFRHGNGDAKSYIYNEPLNSYVYDPSLNQSSYPVEDKPATHDLNQDGHMDMVFGGNRGDVHPSYNTDMPIRIALNNTNGIFSYMSLGVSCGASQGSYSNVHHAIGDLNGDHIPDFISACENGKLLYFEQDEFGNFTHQTISTIDSTRGAQLLDYDLDGDLDLFLSNEFDVIVYTNDSGTFHREYLYNFPQKISSFFVGDLNLDNQIDIILGGNQGRLEVLYGGPTGFDTVLLPTAGTGKFIQVGMTKVNRGDPYPDIIILQEGEGLRYYSCDGTDAIGIYVDQTATGLNNGESWTNAYLHPDSAFLRAKSIDSIFIAQGDYYPDTNGLPDPRDARFKLNRSLRIFGGFPSGGAPFDARDWVNNLTYFNLNLGNLSLNTDNSRVVVNLPQDHTLLFDGLIIKNAFQDEPEQPIMNINGQLELKNTIVERNVTTASSLIRVGMNGMLTIKKSTISQSNSVQQGYFIINHNIGASMIVSPNSNIEK